MRGRNEELLSSLSKLAAIGLMPMSTVDCEGDLSALLCMKDDASNELSGKILNCLMTIVNEGPPIDEFSFDEACIH